MGSFLRCIKYRTKKFPSALVIYGDFVGGLVESLFTITYSYYLCPAPTRAKLQEQLVDPSQHMRAIARYY